MVEFESPERPATPSRVEPPMHRNLLPTSPFGRILESSFPLKSAQQISP